MINVFTIGVYNSTEDSFFSALQSNHIDCFLDIRQRRGVRGAKYKYVNSNYLQEKLSNLGISYIYKKALAPTSEIREKQHIADKLNKETKKKRIELGSVFVHEYKTQILEKFDFQPLLQELEELNVHNVVLFCVEEHAKACHRSLVAEELSKRLSTIVTNI